MLQIKNITKKYQTGNLVQVALNSVSLNLRDNEFVAILGPSGSGKTTLLNIIGGLDHYDDGDLIINEVSTKKYRDRDWDSYRNHTIGFVFQAYNLIPHQSVLANVELALTISGVNKKTRRQKALKALEEVGLKEHAHKLPNQMSGGQMQRVAIARALVNNPDILLADEPTGALDSETSIQVMELLKDVAKDRLVVMVTHNPELAQTYATRIVELKDGKIISDTNPYNPTITKDQACHQNMGHASMSLAMALQLSFNNLKTKKARTILTAFAGSIGIIGIALILSISTGVNDYIKAVEENTLSEYPLTIASSGVNGAALMMEQVNEDEVKEDTIQVFNMVTNMFSTIDSNDLSALKNYFETGNSDIDEYAKAIEYSYSVTPNIYSADTSKIHQINPDKTFEALGMGASSSSNTMMASMMSTDVFYELPKATSLYENQYEVKAGRWPKSYNECVLVLSKSGNISDLVMYALDLKDYSELSSMVEQFANNETVDVKVQDAEYNYDDILNHKFKLVEASDYYVYDEEYAVYVDKSEDEKHLTKMIDEGEDLTIVGIIQPKDGEDVTMLRSGIAYHSDLSAYIIENAKNNPAVIQQIANPDIDIFTGKAFGDDSSKTFNMNSLFSIDQNKMQSAITIDPNAINTSGLKLDANSLKLDLSGIDFNLNDLFAGLKLDFKTEDIEAFAASIQNGFIQYCIEQGYYDPSGDLPENLDSYFQEYLSSDAGKQLLQKELAALLIKSGLTEEYVQTVTERFENVLKTYQNTLMQQLADQISKQLESGAKDMANSIKDAIKFNSNTFMSAITFKLDQEELSELLVSMMANKSSSYEGNLKLLGYADIENPSSIAIYPKDFDAKQKIVEILDDYNRKMESTDSDRVISYTDYVGTLMSSVTDIIDVVSYVLIAFVAISLIVSSIMIGVITYISVLERKKEIGILRAIGASKANIGTVFNAETLIIGLLSGIMGIGITLILLVPINEVIHSIAGSADVSAKLPIIGGVSLVILSVLLTTFSGLIPSNKASKEDPVKALRSE